jgi:hypothetical protein
MDEENDFKDFTDILEELEGEELLDNSQTPEVDEEFETVTDDNVNEFVLKYGSKLVKDGMDAINKVKPKITSGQDADEIKALSEMMRAMNSTLSTLTNIALQNKKEKSATANKQIDHQHKKELPNAPQTTIIVGTREDIFRQLAEAEKQATEVEVVKEDDE